MDMIEAPPAYRINTIPEAPDYLSDGARPEWDTLARLVYEMGTCRRADLRALALLCELLADISRLEAAIRADGVTTQAGSGGIKGHPALANLAAARKHAEQLLGKFGLLPDGRQARKFSAGSHEYQYG